ncbi:MAG: glycosyltransferase [Planctomycetia bacterium]|nr:glycosyltransferase [Planctomycetia bacterium]
MEVANETSNDVILFSILIPVYNEQSYLARVVERVLNVELPHGVKREIVLVDDASTDRTPQVIQELVKKYPETIRAFRQSVNQGKGAAIRRAIQEMQGDFAIIQDADLEYNPDEYSIILAPLLDGRADVVYGSRFATRETRKALQYHHKLGNLFLTHLSNFMTGLDLTDMETCYKAFRADALKSIPLRSNRFGIEPEITAKIAKRGWTVYEVPISYNGRRYSEGKKIGWKDGVSAIYLILKFWFLDDSFTDPDSDSSQKFEYSKNYARRLIKRAEPFLGMKTLEIGAGLGNFSRFLPFKERFTVTESDASRLRFLHASYDGNSNVDVKRFDPLVDATPEQGDEQDSSTYDSIICFNHTEELPLWDAVSLARLRDLLEEGGKLVFVVKAQGNKKSDNVITKKSLRQALQNAGFIVEVLDPFGNIEKYLTPRQKDKAPSLLRFKIFDMLIARTEWFDKHTKPIRYFVVARK